MYRCMCFNTKLFIVNKYYIFCNVHLILCWLRYAPGRVSINIALKSQIVYQTDYLKWGRNNNIR